MPNSFGTPDGIKTEPESEDLLLQNTPLETRDGRPYLRDMPYFLPCDLVELHRQSLRTMLSETIFAAPTCASFASGLPNKVLEVGCGSGYWSSTCYEHFKSIEHDKNVQFTGIDVVSLAPDMQDQGMDWTFMQHDLRSFPWPFSDGEFDYVMVKDVSLAIPLEMLQRFLDECVRVLGGGGTIEIWEGDHLLRCLVQNQQPPVPDAVTRTYPIKQGVSFGPAQNRFIQDANTWMEKACENARLPPTPCVRMAEMLFQEPDLLYDVANKRVAIPLAELAWERLAARRPSVSSKKHKSKSKTTDARLNVDQAAIRHTALMTVIQKIESLEPVLKEHSGKNTEEWASWWANMMSSLVEQHGLTTGECLEIGAWWATKRKRS